MKLYNTLTRVVEEFAPQRPAVGVYACGITPYDTTHLGHAFTYSIVDVLIRYLEYRGKAVRYVQNVTDVDDDLLRVARERGEDWRRMGDRWTAHYIEDMAALNVRPPDVLPRATEVIPQIIDSVERLLAAEVAYRSGDGVYFDIESWAAYGSLSRLSRVEMLPIANERGNWPDDANKRRPLDFVLWQPSAAGEPAWESPWGPGRPGWHIECSSMASHYLGPSIDLHAGGEDLVFPHHESERAQIEPLTGQLFARHWLHVAPVQHRGQKMSKSLGNLVMVRDLLNRCSPDGLRLYLAGHHYRQPWAFDEGTLAAAEADARALASAVEIRPSQGTRLPSDDLVAGFRSSIEDDLNTPGACECLRQFGAAIQHGHAQGKAVGEAQRQLLELAALFGLRLGRSGVEPRVADGWRRHLNRFRAEPVR